MKSATTNTETKGPDRGQSQCKNHLHSKTRLLDYHDSAANVANSAFYSNRVTASRPIVTSNQKSQSFCDPIHKNYITCCALLSGKTKNGVHFAARGIALLWSFFHLNCSASGFVPL